VKGGIKLTNLTEFGKEVKKKLVDLGEPDKWLIEQVREKTGLYFDDSYLYKIRSGKLATPKIVTAIREILDLPAQDHSTTENVQ
jgi:hypothetical protein